MIRALAWLPLLIAATACDASRDAGFGEGCQRDDDCKGSLVCRQFSTTARFDLCDEPRTTRFCTMACKSAAGCVDAGVVPPGANPAACYDACQDAGAHCTWAGEK
ncbi:MAG: hypothetical protein IT374_17620 [Polyangiaceae bacterium]|nr:hypothetical protein [Polyangiaceae bacterium]